MLNSVIIYGKAKVNGTSNNYIGSAATFSNETIKSDFVTLNATAANGGPFVVSGGTWTVSDIYALKLRIYHPYGGSNRQLRFYGADAVINYTLNGVEYEVSFNNQSSVATTEPSSTQYIFQGGNQTIKIKGVSDINNIIVEDNGNNIVNELTYVPSGTTQVNMNPSSLEDYSGYSIAGQGSGYTDTNSTTYCSLGLRGQTNAYVLYSFDTSTIPLGATINSVSCSAKVSVSSTSTSITNKSVQLYTGSTAKGTAYTNITTSTTVFNITAGNNWTVEEVRDIKIKAGASYPNTNYYELRFYGADLTINYTVNETFYVYTISNIQADHVISVSDKQTGSSLYWKNGSWSQYTKIYKKTNNSWVQQTISLDLFDGNKIIVSD